MASCPGLKSFMYIALTLLFFMQGALCGVRHNAVTCASLDSSTCAFAVSSSSTRCVMEKTVRRGGQLELSCRTSQIMAENLTNWIETDECIEVCGLNRNTVGISSESLLDGNFTRKLCSLHCYRGCPDIVDLYFKLAAGEGVFLPKLCEAMSASLACRYPELRYSSSRARVGNR